MVSVEELQARFGDPVVVAPWGECIIVPSGQFEESWRAELAALGLVCRLSDWDRRAVVLVQLKKAVPEGKTVYVPPSKPESNALVSRNVVHGDLEVKELEKKEQTKKQGWATKWTPEEDKLLLEFAGDAKFAVNRLIEPHLSKLPGRTLAACLWRVGYLRKRLEKKRFAMGAVNVADVTGGTDAKKSEKSTEASDNTKSNAQLQAATFAPFTDVWAAAEADESPLKVRIERFYGFARAAGLPPGVVEGFVACLQEVYATVELLGDENAANGKFNVNLVNRAEKLRSDLMRHKHAVSSGEAMLPMEASA
ncbi:MAG: hypothetical protein ACQCN4_11505 [Candidatus Bathyarchaeia archaeon]|jgi:hypothetical protein